MKLILRLNLILVCVFLLGVVSAGIITRDLLRDNARIQVMQNARTMMETAVAVRGYTVTQIRPLLAPMLEQEFLPQSVPAYSLRERHREYIYKEATLNPTTPTNRATDWEADLVTTFQGDPTRTEIVGERDAPWGRSLYLTHPIRITDPGCLTCHTTPESAPPSMVRAYGSANGYGWKLGEVIGAQVVQVPMSISIQMADRASRTLVTSLAVIFLLILLFLNILLYWIVIKPARGVS
jgi:protein-histidine pros-kinase